MADNTAPETADYQTPDGWLRVVAAGDPIPEGWVKAKPAAKQQRKAEDRARKPAEDKAGS